MLSLKTALQSYWQGFGGLIFPSYCAACGQALYRNESILCMGCYAQLPLTGFHNDPENEVARLFWGRVNVEHATSFMYFAKGSRFQQILHELKYNGQVQIGTALGRMLGSELKNTPFSTADMIIPVPLHPSKLKARGYNQSELIATGISEILQLPLETGLIRRTMDKGSQTHKSRYERWENVGQIFHCRYPDALKDKHVMIVDDVITTGATLEACASCLASVTGIKISLVSLAFAKLR
jgi:ComF family protein